VVEASLAIQDVPHKTRNSVKQQKLPNKDLSIDMQPQTPLRRWMQSYSKRVARDG
jgi:hypothetical protein